ncbi:MAG TPA: hypothetical protein VJ741_05760 [Solirubrobacteraceae bacterium]|nr:hypothetical protein [Solirubrobacteraceae bacterium]
MSGQRKIPSSERRKFTNQLLHLDRYERLLETVVSMDGPRTTTQLRAESGLTIQPRGVMGALLMFEVAKRVHPLRGNRTELVWHPGEREGARPDKLPPLGDYLEIRRKLNACGRTALATDVLLRAVGIWPKPGKGTVPSSERERILGALKALVALGEVQPGKYGAQGVTWRWANATWEYDLREIPERVGFESLVYDSRGRPIRTVEEQVSLEQYGQRRTG